MRETISVTSEDDGLYRLRIDYFGLEKEKIQAIQCLLNCWLGNSCCIADKKEMESSTGYIISLVFVGESVVERIKNELFNLLNTEEGYESVVSPHMHMGDTYIGRDQVLGNYFNKPTYFLKDESRAVSCTCEEEKDLNDKDVRAVHRWSESEGPCLLDTLSMMHGERDGILSPSPMDFRSKVYNGITFYEKNLVGLNFENSSFAYCKFSGSLISSTILNLCNITNAEGLNEAQLSLSYFCCLYVCREHAEDNYERQKELIRSSMLCYVKQLDNLLENGKEKPSSHGFFSGWWSKPKEQKDIERIILNNPYVEQLRECARSCKYKGI